ncbi:DUF1638 domain-containing protein [Pseudooceanicola algae]|nr:DUF1638 domain-containing protein [Pseudooceanicola algae]
MPIPDDATLTRRGHAVTQPDGRILVLACGALAREILALIDLNGWSHVDLHCLPAILHNRPDRIPDAVEQAVTQHRPGYARIFVAYADCGTGGLLQATCDRLGVQMIAGAHCYAFFDGLAAFAARDEVTAFYLTDFLARQFDTFVWKPLGLDRHPELRDMYFGNYDRLVYLAQTEDAALTEQARACAERLGLTFERRFTGYGDLATELARGLLA